MQVLLEAGADLEARDGNGRTALHSASAAIEGREAVEFLLHAGADLEARDGSGRTALHIAALESESPRSVGFLLDAGADASAITDSGRTVHDLLLVNDRLKPYGTSYSALLERVPAPD